MFFCARRAVSAHFSKGERPIGAKRNRRHEKGWPGLARAVAVPAVWAGWWMLAQRPKPLPEEEVMEKQGKIHIVTEEVFL